MKLSAPLFVSSQQCFPSASTAHFFHQAPHIHTQRTRLFLYFCAFKWLRVLTQSRASMCFSGLRREENLSSINSWSVCGRASKLFSYGQELQAANCKHWQEATFADVTIRLCVFQVKVFCCCALHSFFLLIVCLFTDIAIYGTRQLIILLDFCILVAYCMYVTAYHLKLIKCSTNNSWNLPPWKKEVKKKWRKSLCLTHWHHLYCNEVSA